MNEVINLQGITMKIEDAARYFQEGKRFFFKYRKVYRLQFSRNYKYNYFLEEATNLKAQQNELPYTLRGKFVALRADEANDLIGYNFFNA